MSDLGDFQERYRRVRAVIQAHPGLSGLAEDECMDDLDEMLVFMGGRERLHKSKPHSCSEPDWELEIGYDDIPEENPRA